MEQRYQGVLSVVQDAWKVVEQPPTLAIRSPRTCEDRREALSIAGIEITGKDPGSQLPRFSPRQKDATIVRVTLGRTQPAQDRAVG